MDAASGKSRLLDRSAASWALGAVVAVAVLGPAVRPGALLHLDLVVVDDAPTPSGIWGLGPELPRRVPLFAPLSWASHPLGTYAAKTLLGLAIVVAFVGAARLVSRSAAGSLAAIGAGLLYAANPWMLTRISAGHVTLVVAAALLPWAVPVLLDPGRDIGRTARWSAALGACGFAGGTFAIPLVVAGSLRRRAGVGGEHPETASALAGRGMRVGGVVLATQLPWIVPGVIVAAGGTRAGDAAVFATDLDGIGGTFRLVAGHGFWQAGTQVGRPGAAVALAGAALLALALAGHGRLPASWRNPASVVAAVALAVAAASALPGVESWWRSFAKTDVGAPVREAQRILPLFLVWLAPAAALGCVRIAEAIEHRPERAGARPRGRAVAAHDLAADAIGAVSVVLALALAAPGLWGNDGRLEPVTYPASWREARAQVRAAPGPVLALPWHQYLDFDFARGRSLYPAADWFAGDVIVSSDPEVGPASAVQVDPRAPAVEDALERARRGEAVAPALAAIGVRWVFLARTFDAAAYEGALRRDPGLRAVTSDADAVLFAVRDWRGDAWTAATDARASVRSPVAPLATVRTDERGPVVVARPHQAGWLAGRHAAVRTDEGLLRIPGPGRLWFWPALLVVAADAIAVAVVVGSLADGRRTGRRTDGRRTGGRGSRRRRFLRRRGLAAQGPGNTLGHERALAQ